MKFASKPILRSLVSLSALIVAALACNFLVPVNVNSTLVVALQSNGSPTLAVYVGNSQEDPFWLPAGEYYLEIMDSKGMVYEGWWEVVQPVSKGGDTISISQRISGKGQSDEVVASQLQTLANFIISVDLAQLTYLEIASGGFQESFQVSMENIQMSDADPFYARLQEIAEQEEAVFVAIKALEFRADLAASSSQSVPSSSLASKVSARPYSGIWDVWDSVKSFFSFKSEEDERGRQEILTISAAMTPGEKEEAFYWLGTEKIEGAQNYDEFLALLQAGELEDITSIRSDLYTGGPYQGVFQTVNPDSNRPGGENIHRVGAELITRGAELEWTIVKEVLSTAFPGMEQGFEYADKIDEWANFVQNMYINPLGTIRDWGVDKIKGEIQDNIKWDLINAMPDIDEATAEQMAEHLTGEIIETHAGLVSAISEAQSGQKDDAVDCTGVGEAEYQLAVQKLGLTPEQPIDPEKASYIVCTDQATGLPVSATLVEENVETEEDADESLSEGEDAYIPVGIYIGETNFPLLWSNHLTHVGEDEIILIVEEDGTTYGEVISIFNFSESFEEGVLYFHMELNGVIEGKLTDIHGELTSTYTWHYYVTGYNCPPCDDYTIEWDVPYEIHVSGNMMSGVPSNEIDEPEIWPFELTRQ